MFKLEEICEELSQIQIPMRSEELESIGIHVEEEASTDEVERFQDGYIRAVHNCLAERRRHGCRAALVRPAATAAILEVDPVEAYLIWQFTDLWLPYTFPEIGQILSLLYCQTKKYASSYRLGTCQATVLTVNATKHTTGWVRQRPRC